MTYVLLTLNKYIRFHYRKRALKGTALKWNNKRNLFLWTSLCIFFNRAFFPHKRLVLHIWSEVTMFLNQHAYGFICVIAISCIHLTTQQGMRIYRHFSASLISIRYCLLFLTIQGFLSRCRNYNRNQISDIYDFLTIDKATRFSDFNRPDTRRLCSRQHSDKWFAILLTIILLNICICLQRKFIHTRGFIRENQTCVRVVATIERSEWRPL